MKKQLLLILSAIFISSFVSGQQWLDFPLGSSQEWVSLGDLDVPGNQITVEALVSVHDTNRFVGLNIVSKHTGPIDVNYLLRPASWELTTDSGFVRLENPILLCPDSVFHLAGTYDGDSLKYFVNGVQVASARLDGNLFQNNLTAAIGNRVSNPNEPFLGSIDEVRIWNVVRSQSELSSNMYNLPSPASQQGLLAYYKFDGNYTNAQGASNLDGTPVGTLQSFIINPYFSGAFTPNFCSSISSVSENSVASDLSLYPNPTSGTFTFELHSLLAAGQVTITNLLGETIIEIPLTSLKTEVVLDQPDGIYFASWKNNNGTNVVKFLISR